MHLMKLESSQVSNIKIYVLTIRLLLMKLHSHFASLWNTQIMEICIKKSLNIKKNSYILKKRRCGEFLFKLFKDLNLYMMLRFCIEI